MKALTLTMTLALLTSAVAFADDGGEYPRTRDERNSCDGYPETCEEKGPTILFNQKWENPNEQDDKAADPLEEIGSDGVPLFCHQNDAYMAYGQRVKTECKVKEAPITGGEGPGFVPYKHCVTGELVSKYLFDKECGVAVPTHGVCRSIGKEKDGITDIVRCQ